MEAAGGTRQFGTVSLTGLGTGGADHLPQHRVHERCRSEHRRSGVRENESESESAIRVGMGGSESAHAHHRCGPTRGLQAGPARGHGLAVAGVAAGGGRPEAAACRLVAHPSTPPGPPPFAHVRKIHHFTVKINTDVRIDNPPFSPSVRTSLMDDPLKFISSCDLQFSRKTLETL